MLFPTFPAHDAEVDRIIKILERDLFFQDVTKRLECSVARNILFLFRGINYNFLKPNAFDYE